MLRSKILLTSLLTLFVVLTTNPLRAQSENADTLFAHAKAEAQKQHKNILLVFSASWCGPCKRYERFLEDAKIGPATEKAFVVLRLDVGERKGDPKHADTLGAVALRTVLGAKDEPGFPFLVITDESGKPLINSYLKGDTNGNIGYPALPEEIDWYLEMLRRGAPSMTPEDIALNRDWLTRNAH